MFVFTRLFTFLYTLIHFSALFFLFCVLLGLFLLSSQKTNSKKTFDRQKWRIKKCAAWVQISPQELYQIGTRSALISFNYFARLKLWHRHCVCKMMFKMSGCVNVWQKYGTLKWVSQTDSYSLSQAACLSIRFRAEGLVCATTSRKSAVVTVSSWMAGMSESPVKENPSEATVFYHGHFTLNMAVNGNLKSCRSLNQYLPGVTREHQRSCGLVSWRPPYTPVWYQSQSNPPSPETHTQAYNFIQCTLVSVVPDIHDSLHEKKIINIRIHS